MKAPEKIYICPSDRAGIDYDEDWSEYPCSISIEYVCKDVFIEEAKKYLEEHFINDVSVIAAGPVNIQFNQAFENFINYMKGK